MTNDNGSLSLKPKTIQSLAHFAISLFPEKSSFSAIPQILLEAHSAQFVVCSRFLCPRADHDDNSKETERRELDG